MIHTLHRARQGILVIALMYTISLGIFMTHNGSRFALSYPDSLVAAAHRDDPASRADDVGQHLRAAAIDFSRNLFMGAIPEQAAVSGLIRTRPSLSPATDEGVGLSVRPINAIQRRGCARTILTARLRNYLLFRAHPMRSAAISAATTREGLTAPAS